MSEPSTSNAPPQPDMTSSPPWWHWRRISLRYKRRARQRMKAAAEHALDALDKTLEIAGGAAGDAGVPGLAGALSAVRVVLQKIQAMKTNIEGVDSLAANIVSLRSIVEDFVKHREGQQISKDTLDQIAELEKTWAEIAQKASDIKSRGRIRRFFASNADTKKLEEFVGEINSSIHERFMLRSILNIKEDVHAVRCAVEVVRKDVEIVREGVEVVAGGIQQVHGDVQVVRKDVEVVHEDVEVIRADVGAVREDMEVVREDVEIVREDVEVVLDGVGALSEDVQVVRKNVNVVREDVTVVREDVQVVLEDIEVVREGVEAIGEGVEEVREDAKVVREDVVEIRQNTGATRKDVQVVREDLQEVLQDVKVILEGSFITTYAKNAQYDAGGVERRSCLEGTRVDVLERLRSWIIAACTRTTAILEAGSVFWINGFAGTGKTTIARTVAEWSDKQKLLAASFFCSRSDNDCSNPNLIFPTLSRQLCHFHAPFKEKITEILKRNPDVIHANPLLQIEELIVKPLEAVRDTFPTSVIVLDALDECLDKEATSIILTAIARFIHRISGSLLFVVTSRPERSITVLFEEAEQDTLKDVATPLLLHKIDLKSVLDDIRLFLEDGFKWQSRQFTVGKGWPVAHDVNKLAEMSGGLFIWAATALRFIMDKDTCDPKGQLRLLLNALPDTRPGETDLNLLYDQITSAVFTKASSALANRLRPILGAIALAQEPLSIGTLATLVELEEDDVRNALTRLGSVLHVPGPEKPAEAIHIVHLTFPEFLLTSSPTKPEAFHISAPDHHLAMFTRCMVIMRDLKRNIACIKSPSAFKSEIPGLEKTVTECIPPALGYACRYWTTHLVLCVESTHADSSYDVFSEFLHCYYLYWLEACSLLGIIEGAVNAHYAVLQACQTLGGRFAELMPLLGDCRRFALTYASCVDMAPLQLYHSALALAPTKSLVKKAYSQDLDASLIICRGARSKWAPCLDSFQAHNGWSVDVVAFSPSGDYFITGGGDNKLRMWKPTTRTMILSFDGHSREVCCVACSPNGVYVASGLVNGDVHVWQLSTGECVRVLRGNATDWIVCMVFLVDEQHILFCTSAGDVKLWDLSDGRCILTPNPTCKNPIWQAGISPDGCVVARGNDFSLILHDRASATNVALDFPEQVEAATFSPDGRYVAARSSNVIRVWRFADRSLVRTIDFPDDVLRGRLAFSPDGAHIGCGSRKGSVYLWQVVSEAPPRVLRGHTSPVKDLSWSPNGLEIVSVSFDGTVRVWDSTQPSTDAEDVASQYRPAVIGPVRFVLARGSGQSPLLHLPLLDVDMTDFAALASVLPKGAPALTPFADMVDVWDAMALVTGGLSDIACIRPWAAISGQHHVQFIHLGGILPRWPVAISSDGFLMAYQSLTSYCVVDICGLRTGKGLPSLARHTDDVLSISFSPDGTLIATGSQDKSVKVWDSAKGAMLHSHDKHTGMVLTLVFSPDGHLVASASHATVHVFEATTGRVVQLFKWHRTWIKEVAFAAENTRILALDASYRFYINDMATSTCIYDISLQGDFWIHSLNFSPDGTGVLVPGESSHDALTVPLWKPCDRNWPMYAVSKEGWLYEKGPGFTARLCWLPPEWRDVFPLENGQLCTPRRAVVFDVSQLPDYVQM